MHAVRVEGTCSWGVKDHKECSDCHKQMDSNRSDSSSANNNSLYPFLATIPHLAPGPQLAQFSNLSPPTGFFRYSQQFPNSGFPNFPVQGVPFLCIPITHLSGAEVHQILQPQAFTSFSNPRTLNNSFSGSSLSNSDVQQFSTSRRISETEDSFCLGEGKEESVGDVNMDVTKFHSSLNLCEEEVPERKRSSKRRVCIFDIPGQKLPARSPPPQIPTKPRHSSSGVAVNDTKTVKVEKSGKIISAKEEFRALARADEFETRPKDVNVENKQLVNGIIKQEKKAEEDPILDNHGTLIKNSEKIQTATPSKPIVALAKQNVDVVDSSSRIKPATKPTPTVAQPKTKHCISKEITDFLEISPSRVAKILEPPPVEDVNVIKMEKRDEDEKEEIRVMITEYIETKDFKNTMYRINNSKSGVVSCAEDIVSCSLRNGNSGWLKAAGGILSEMVLTGMVEKSGIPKMIADKFMGKAGLCYSKFVSFPVTIGRLASILVETFFTEENLNWLLEIKECIKDKKHYDIWRNFCNCVKTVFEERATKDFFKNLDSKSKSSIFEELNAQNRKTSSAKPSAPILPIRPAASSIPLPNYSDVIAASRLLDSITAAHVGNRIDILNKPLNPPKFGETTDEEWINENVRCNIYFLARQLDIVDALLPILSSFGVLSSVETDEAQRLPTILQRTVYVLVKLFCKDDRTFSMFIRILRLSGNETTVNLFTSSTDISNCDQKSS